MNRRRFLRTGGLAACGILAGCQGREFSTPSDCATPFESVPEGNWPMAGRDAVNTSYAPTRSGSIADQSTKIEPATGTALYKPIIVDGVLYAPPVSNGNFPHAIDLSTGEVLWRFERGRGITPPAYADGRVVFCKSISSDRLAYAFDAESGDQQWEFEMDAEVGTVPRASDGTAFVTQSERGGPAKLFALDVATGEPRWEFQSGGVGTPAIADGTVFVAAGEGIVALDAETGEHRWQGRADTEDTAISPPSVSDGILVVGEEEGIKAYDACTSNLLWRNETDSGVEGSEGVYTTPAIADGTVYGFVMSDQPEPAGSVQAFDLVTGERQWKTRIEFYMIDRIASPVVTDDAVVLPRDPTILDKTQILDREDGSIRRELDVGGYSAVVIEGHLMLSHPDGIHDFEIE